VGEMLKKHCRGLVFSIMAFTYVASACAGADEDYLAGLKSYRDGDVVGSMAPLRKAADAGHPKAQVLFAEVLDRAEFDEDAIAYYRKAANQGEPDGMVGLASMLAGGEGVKKKDPLEAREWIQKAAELGHVQATNLMAQAYMRAELGITEAETNSATALHWIELAAQQDYLPAVDALVQAYRLGDRLTVSADQKNAERYLAQANRLRGIEPGKGKKKGRKAQTAPATTKEVK
jgi:TPR repeat protein